MFAISIHIHSGTAIATPHTFKEPEQRYFGTKTEQVHLGQSVGLVSSESNQQKLHAE